MNPQTIWQEFIAALRDGPLPTARIRPYPGLENLDRTLVSILADLRPAILSAAEREIEPDCTVIGDHNHFILPLGSEKDSFDFCFSFIATEDQWYFQHVETIFIRLDHTAPAPVSEFPDISAVQKVWARDELEVSQMVRLYIFLKAEKGQDFALDWFRDGERYLTGVRAWVPFLPLYRAFILYICWDLANLHANPITLVHLDESSASIIGSLRYFELYQRAAHLAQQIGQEEYLALFETIWHDRACCAGWHLEIKVEGVEVRLNFRK